MHPHKRARGLRLSLPVPSHFTWGFSLCHQERELTQKLEGKNFNLGLISILCTQGNSSTLTFPALTVTRFYRASNLSSALMSRTILCTPISCVCTDSSRGAEAQRKGSISCRLSKVEVDRQGALRSWVGVCGWAIYYLAASLSSPVMGAGERICTTQEACWME